MATKRDETNKTLSQPGGSVTYDNATGGKTTITNTGKTYNANTDYSAEAKKYAEQGDWDAVDEALKRRADKMADTGSTGGGVSNEKLWSDLNAQYGGPSSGSSGSSGSSNRNNSGGSSSSSRRPSSGAAAPVSPATGLRDYLDQWLASAKAQAELKTDYAVQQGVNELTRAEEDAQEQFQTQRNQIDIDEAKAKDNQALYAGAQGDKGGIGAAQYDAIMNNAAQNRLAVNSAQTKLSTDTARQISDLRAQGEFEKADSLLQLGQTYLSQLMSLEQWALEYGLSTAQFQASLDQWAKEYEMQLGNMLGTFQGVPTLEAQKLQNNQLASAGEALLAAGIMPSESQLAAMGLTADQAQSYLTVAQLAASSKGSTSSSGGGGGGGNPTGTATPSGSGINALFLAAYESGQPAQSFLKQSGNYKAYGLNSQPSSEEYEAWVESLPEPMSSKAFKTWLDKLNINLSESNLSTTGQYSVNQDLMNYWPVLTEAQRLSVLDLCSHYGIDFVYE